MVRMLVGIVGLTLILLVGGIVVQGAYDRSGKLYQIDDETITGNPSLDPGVYTLDNSNIADAHYRETVTVTNSTGTVIMVEDQDYIWHENNGTIEVIAGGRLDGSDQMVVDYKFTIPGAEGETELLEIYSAQLTFSSALILAMFAALFIAGMKVFGGM